MFGNVLTEKIEELLLAWMHPVLEHRSFSLDVRIRVLKENLGFVIAYQPRAAVRGHNAPVIGCSNTKNSCHCH